MTIFILSIAIISYLICILIFYLLSKMKEIDIYDINDLILSNKSHKYNCYLIKYNKKYYYNSNISIFNILKYCKRCNLKSEYFKIKFLNDDEISNIYFKLSKNKIDFKSLDLFKKRQVINFIINKQ